MGFISLGDFIDLFYKAKGRGIKFILGKMSFHSEKRTKSTWNNINNDSSNWWILEAVRKRWNKLITGNEDIDYEDYIAVKYLDGKKNVSILSVGCGEGGHEIAFGKYTNITSIKGIDIAASPLNTARQKAARLNLEKIIFENTSFEKFISNESFDLILFHSSLHHFKNIPATLLKANNMLSDNGLVIIHEYTGPDMFQFGKQRKDLLNKIFKSIPANLKRRLNSKRVKKTVYEPGILRMYIADPSEACSSSAIMESLNRQFNVIEEEKIGGDILHFLLKDIAHNFLSLDHQAASTLHSLFEIEDEYIFEKKYSDFMFGVYQKK
ncbi:MAG: class I SAM-dependent methyltransferase [Ferruginibacter sp.]